MVDWDTAAGWLEHATPLETLAIGAGSEEDHSRTHRLSAGGRIRRPRARLGRRDSPRPRAWGDAGLRREFRRPRRAHDRAARRLRDLRRPDRAWRRGARGVAARRRRPSEPRFPPARRAAAALGRDRRLRGRAHRPRAPPVGDAHVSLRLPRSQGGRSRRPRRSRDRPVCRPQAARRRARPAGVHGAALRRRRQALRPGRAARPRSEIHRRVAARARSARRHDVGKGQDARQEGDARHGGGAVEALCRAQGRPRPRLLRRHALAAGIRGRVRMGPDAGSEDRDQRHQGRHGNAVADGSPALRRRRLRQDRGRDARGVQGGHGRQAGRRPGADDGPGVSARENAEEPLRRVPGARRHAQPLPQQGGAEGHHRRCRRRQGRGRRRHAPPAVEGRAVPRSRAAGRRRRAALRRRAQGADQADAPARRRPDDDRDADPAHAEHVAGRHSRHVDHRDAAARSPVDPDQRGEVRSGGDLARDPDRDGARRSDLLRAQPRRVDLLARQPDHAAGAGSAALGRRRTGRWARTSSSA